MLSAVKWFYLIDKPIPLYFQNKNSSNAKGILDFLLHFILSHKFTVSSNLKSKKNNLIFYFR